MAGSYHDVLIEVKSALPGLAIDEWDVVPPAGQHSDPCWWTLVTTAWAERYRRAVSELGISEFATSLPDLTDGAEGLTHIVNGVGLAEAIVSGAVMRSLCGRRFVPSHDPDKRPICTDCAKLLLTWERIMDEASGQLEE